MDLVSLLVIFVFTFTGATKSKMKRRITKVEEGNRRIFLLLEEKMNLSDDWTATRTTVAEQLGRGLNVVVEGRKRNDIYKRGVQRGRG